MFNKISKENKSECLCLFAGLHQAFCSGIYSPSIGFTLQFGNRSKQLVPLSGVFLGLGQVIGRIY